MKVHVRLFALIRERAGTAHAELELAPGARVGEALAALGRRYPAAREVLEPGGGLLLMSINREYATPGQTLEEGDELALFPPVSGGATASGLEPADAILLLSGGFDSPVAGHLLRAHGWRLDAVHFSLEPFTDDASRRKAVQLAAHLGIPRLTIIPLGSLLAEVSQRCDAGSYFVLQKRFMVRLAERVARRAGARALVTGENLGQVSSQTLTNLAAIDAAATLPVLRPLLGLDKTDIVARARHIGTYEASCGPEICDTLGPRHPRTAVSLSRVLSEESKLDVEALVRRGLAGAVVVEPIPAPAAASSATASS